MPLDLPPSHPSEYVYHQKETTPPKTVHYNEIAKNLSQSQEKPVHTVEFGKQSEKLSSYGAKTYPVFVDGKRVGALVKCESQSGWNSKAMFVSAQRSPLWFTTDSQGRYFPNIDEIQKYFSVIEKETGKKRQITMIATGPMFDKDNKEKSTGLNYDNGKSVGTDMSRTGVNTAGRGIVSIVDGKLTFSHISKVSDDDIQSLVNKSADIMTMPSAFNRNNKPGEQFNTTPSIWSHKHSHFLVEFVDGGWGVLVLNNVTPQQKKDVLSTYSNIVRAMHCDARGDQSYYLDGMWINGENKLQYSHPSQGDKFTNESTSPSGEVKGNIPAIVIYYTEKSK